MELCGYGGIGSFEHDRVLWTIKGMRKGAAVKIPRRSKPKEILGTARVARLRGIEPDRCRWQMKEGRNGAAVKGSVPLQGTKKLWEPQEGVGQLVR